MSRSLVYVTARQSGNPLGYNQVVDESDGTLPYASVDPVEIRMLLEDDGITEILFDADGNGSMVLIPVVWIGDGAPLEGSARVFSLISR